MNYGDPSSLDGGRGREGGRDQINKTLLNCFEENIGQMSHPCVCFQGSVQAALKEVEDLREERNHKNPDNLKQERQERNNI